MENQHVKFAGAESFLHVSKILSSQSISRYVYCALQFLIYCDLHICLAFHPNDVFFPFFRFRSLKEYEVLETISA
jgi:hypothetical protein